MNTKQGIAPGPEAPAPSNGMNSWPPAGSGEHAGSWRTLHIEINEDGTVGGSHQALFDLVRSMDRSRFEPVVLFNQNNAFVPRFRHAGIETHVFEAERVRERRIRETGGKLAKALEAVRAVGRRYRFLRRHRIDLVHINNSPYFGNDDWLPAARLAGVPIVASSLGEAVVHDSIVLRWLSRKFDMVMPNSDYIAATVARSGIPADRLQRIYPGVDIHAVRERARRDPAAVRAELGIGQGTNLVAMVGNIREWKGQHVVLEALRLLRESTRRQTHVIFVGATAPADASYAARLKTMVTEYGLGEHVSFLGSRDDVPDLMKAADLVVHSSVRPEPFGLVVTEAMALGKAVVASNIGGPAEIVTPESGVVFKPGDPAELARVLNQFLEDPPLRQCLGASAAERVWEFSIDRHVAATQAVYVDLLRNRTPRAASGR